MKALIVDGHWACRAGLKPILTQLKVQLEVLEVGTFDEAVSLSLEDKDIRLIVLDPLSSGMRSFEAFGEIVEGRPEATVVIFATAGGSLDILRFIDMGAAGCIPKTDDGTEITKSLERMLSGQISLPRSCLEAPSGKRESAASMMLGKVTDQEAISQLTPRQRQVLACLAQGMTNTNIARELGLSGNTVRIHVSAILRSLKLQNRTQAALLGAGHLRGGNAL